MAELSFAENRLEGPIPESMGNMVALESLDLSHNKLSGGIPKSLVALSHLNYLNVSNNRLSGEIPIGGPFVNFSYDSFLSNEALCGAARLQIPACRSNSPSRKRKKEGASYCVDLVGGFFSNNALSHAHHRFGD